jgi:membrane protease subunit HflC
MSQSHHQAPDRELERLPIWRLVFRVILATIIVGLLIAYSMCFQVSEGYKAVVTRFGDPVRSAPEAGLYWKWPWPIDLARQVDVRRRLHNTPYTATFTRDRRNIVLLTYVVWHVEDPLLYIQSVGDREEAEKKLNGIVVDAKNQYMGQYELSALVSTDPDEVKTDVIEQGMLADVAKQAAEKFGIHVEQVGIKRIAYPEENMTAVLRQMREERNAEALKLRSEGEREANAIRDDATVQREQILRAGREEAGKIRGGAEAEAAKIYDVAQSLDPDFFNFWRQLKTIERTLRDKATIILGTNRGIFKILTDIPQTPETATGPNRPVRADAAATTDQTSAPATNSPEETS